MGRTAAAWTAQVSKSEFVEFLESTDSDAVELVDAVRNTVEHITNGPCNIHARNACARAYVTHARTHAHMHAHTYVWHTCTHTRMQARGTGTRTKSMNGHAMSGEMLIHVAK